MSAWAGCAEARNTPAAASVTKQNFLSILSTFRPKREILRHDVQLQVQSNARHLDAIMSRTVSKGAPWADNSSMFFRLRLFQRKIPRISTGIPLLAIPVPPRQSGGRWAGLARQCTMAV